MSGLVSMMEEARGVGLLAGRGWHPKRTIVYCAWDGEEPGLLGSTEWVETHADELTREAAVYINSDGNGRGFFSAGGSHTLEKFVNQVAHDVTDPEKHVSVSERLKAPSLAPKISTAAKPACLSSHVSSDGIYQRSSQSSPIGRP